MTSFDTQPSSELETERLWDDVSERLQSFIDAWEAEDAPPALADYLPAADDRARSFVLVELVKIDMEHRWQRDLAPQSIGAYCEAFPELTDDNRLPLDLIYEEFHIRKQHGDAIDVDDYVQRFPDKADELRRMLQVDRPFQTTSLYRVAPHFEFSAGDVVDDFELVAQIGKGAFAAVFLATQRSMQRMVALKISSDRGREPQTLARLDHPFIVRIFDQRPLPDQDLRLLYMQYVRGGTVLDALNRLRTQPRSTWNGKRFLAAVDAVLIERGAEIPHDSSQRQQLSESTWPEVVCLLGYQLAEALDYAHHQGVLHRDLKPANILLSNSASPKLVDFNVSSCSKVEGASPTAYFGGSLAYMSPEQMEACNPKHELTAESLDGRSDIYSLGVVLWELLTGYRPFDDSALGEGWGSTLDAMHHLRHEGVPAVSLDQVPDDCPEGLRETLMRCLSPTPGGRFQTALGLADQLRLCLQPAAFRLLTPPKTRLRQLLASHPMIMMVLVVLIPHAIAGVFNFFYNKALIKPLAESERFAPIVIAINGVAFPVGVAVGLWIIWRVTQQVKQRSRAPQDEPAPLDVRHRCLRLGHLLALLAIAEWSAGGNCLPGPPEYGGNAHSRWRQHALLWILAALRTDRSDVSVFPGERDVPGCVVSHTTQTSHCDSRGPAGIQLAGTD